MSRLIETHSARNPRLLFFHGVVVALLLTLVGGLAYRQLFKTALYSERARVQNQRRVIAPGPRGNILDREHRVLVGNRLRLSVSLDLAELRPEFKQQYAVVKNNYAKLEKDERPNSSQMQRIARTAVAQRYLDQINFILGRNEQVRTDQLNRHMDQSLLLPFVLLDDLAPEEYARLIERVPVASPLQVSASPTRYYPFDSAAAHTLGYTGVNSNPEVQNFEGEDLLTFKMQGSYGRDGLEKKFDEQLQGETGAAIYLVDPKGYKVKADLPQRKPVQGHDLVTSLDIDLQLAAEGAIGERIGVAVALDIKTGEVLVLASKPDYDLNAFVPHLTLDEKKEIDENNAWFNQAVSGTYPPGSTFKLVTAIAGLRSGTMQSDQRMIEPCDGRIMVGNRSFTCDNGDGRHGPDNLARAIGDSCDVYFYQAGLLITPDVIAAEARRFHLHERTGIELPGEAGRMIVPDPAWKERRYHEKWFPGDTANMSIGQGFVDLSPMGMACFAASLARNETYTRPTLLHHADAPTQHTEPIGLTPAQRAVLLEGMEGCVTYGTANVLQQVASEHIPGVRVAGKTGTAQKQVKQGDKVGFINCAWFICFAPLENPEIAVAVMIEGENIGESYGGGRNAAPVANAVLKKYFAKKNQPKDAVPVFSVK